MVDNLWRRALTNWPFHDRGSNLAFFLTTVCLILVGWIIYLKNKERINRRGYTGAQCFWIEMLAVYTYIVLASTVFTREAMGFYQMEHHFLWSYRWGFEKYGKGLVEEVILNMFLLFPIGVMFPLARPRARWWQAGLLGATISLVIEVLQLCWQKGLFEYDDVFHNTLGTIAGYVLCVGIRGIARKIMRRRGCEGSPVSD